MKKSVFLLIAILFFSACNQPTDTIYSKDIYKKMELIKPPDYNGFVKRGISYYPSYELTGDGEYFKIYDITEKANEGWREMIEENNKWLNNNNLLHDTSSFKIIIEQKEIRILPIFLQLLNQNLKNRYHYDDFLFYVIDYGQTNVFPIRETNDDQQQNYTLGVYLTKDNKYAVCWLYYYD